MHFGELSHHRRKQHRAFRFTDRFHSGCAFAATYQTGLAAVAHACGCPSAPRHIPTTTPSFRAFRLPTRTTPATHGAHPQGRNSPARAPQVSPITPNEPPPHHATAEATQQQKRDIERAGAKRRRVSDENTKATEEHVQTLASAVPATDPAQAHDAEASPTEWTLQFDGGCRDRDAKAAGAGALLMNSE
ncbi:hypothetical protein V7S43_002162 [Phytophthora oleae]|uniref:Uncharacterized protein n=1 Tax=Phytophthora oleae TaxID=2107226 RepID=A0ABD3G4E5_9STRA